MPEVLDGGANKDKMSLADAFDGCMVAGAAVVAGFDEGVCVLLLLLLLLLFVHVMGACCIPNGSCCGCCCCCGSCCC